MFHIGILNKLLQINRLLQTQGDTPALIQTPMPLASPLYACATRPFAHNRAAKFRPFERHKPEMVLLEFRLAKKIRRSIKMVSMSQGFRVNSSLREDSEKLGDFCVRLSPPTSLINTGDEHTLLCA